MNDKFYYSTILPGDTFPTQLTLSSAAKEAPRTKVKAMKVFILLYLDTI